MKNRFLSSLLAVMIWTSFPLNSGADKAAPVVQAKLDAAMTAYNAGDFTRAHDIWLPFAEAGNAEAQFRVGRLYDFGEGVSKQDRKAMEYYILAEQQGHLDSRHNLALLYFDSDFIESDFSKSWHLSLKNACMGVAETTFLLGLHLLGGINTDTNKVLGLAALIDAISRGYNDEGRFETLTDELMSAGYIGDKTIALARSESKAWQKLCQAQ